MKREEVNGLGSRFLLFIRLDRDSLRSQGVTEGIKQPNIGALTLTHEVFWTFRLTAGLRVCRRDAGGAHWGLHKDTLRPEAHRGPRPGPVLQAMDWKSQPLPKRCCKEYFKKEPCRSINADEAVKSGMKDVGGFEVRFQGSCWLPPKFRAFQAAHLSRRFTFTLCCGILNNT